MTRREHENVRSFKLLILETSHKLQQSDCAVFLNAVCAVGMGVDDNGFLGVFAL